MTDALDLDARPTIVYCVYDLQERTILHAWESQREAQTWCDERNNWQMWDRYVVESDDAGLWGDDQIRWAD